MNSKTADVIIVGAGLTGLSMAWFLQEEGKKVFLLEKEKKTGGVINTVSEKGFTFETGPNTGVLSTPEIANLFLELKDFCRLATANPKSKKRYILKRGKWQPLPSGLLSGITTPLFTFNDKLRLLGEPFRKPGADPDESVAQLVIRRMGSSFLDYAVDPFISGIYAGDPEKLITRYALPKLYNLEQNYGSFIKGAIKKAKEPKTDAQKRATGEVFSVEGGLGSLIKALNQKIGIENIFTDAQDNFISPVAGGYNVSLTHSGETLTLTAPVVVTTTGGYGLPELLPFISPVKLKPITDLHYAGIVQAALGYNVWRGIKPDAFGGLIPSKERREILGILFPSAIFGGRAPETGALLSVFLGGVKRPAMISKSDEELREIVLRETGEMMSNSDLPDLFKIYRYSHAIPQYEKSTGERLECIKSLQDQYPGLILAGNIRDGIGMADRVKQAKHISDLITGHER